MTPHTILALCSVALSTGALVLAVCAAIPATRLYLELKAERRRR